MLEHRELTMVESTRRKSTEQAYDKVMCEYFSDGRTLLRV